MQLYGKLKIGEMFKAQFRAEFFNFTNSPHYNNPNATVTSGDFGRITSTNPNARNRSVRFGLRLEW